MATTTILMPTTAAVTNKGVKYMAAPDRNVSFLASGLAGAETITPYVGIGGGWVALYDSSGTQLKLTATKPQLTLAGGCHYAFEKDATASAAGLAAAPVET